MGTTWQVSGRIWAIDVPDAMEREGTGEQVWIITGEDGATSACLYATSYELAQRVVMALNALTQADDSAKETGKETHS
jgi:hypothetical protein